MFYHDTSSGVFTSLSGLEQWFGELVKKRNDWLVSKNCSGCFVKFDDIPHPDSFPVLISVNWDGSWGCKLTFIYPDQIRLLLKLEGARLEEHNEVNNPMEDREI